MFCSKVSVQIFPKFSINTKKYILYRETILKDVVKPWSQTQFGDKRWTFQQDSAPAHRAKASVEWCRENFPDIISPQEWPPYSPDLNPLDYSIWGVLEANACAKTHTSLEALKSSLQREWTKIPQETLSGAVDGFPKRLTACIKNKGDFFE